MPAAACARRRPACPLGPLPRGVRRPLGPPRASPRAVLGVLEGAALVRAWAPRFAGRVARPALSGVAAPPVGGPPPPPRLAVPPPWSRSVASRVPLAPGPRAAAPSGAVSICRCGRRVVGLPVPCVAACARPARVCLARSSPALRPLLARSSPAPRPLLLPAPPSLFARSSPAHNQQIASFFWPCRELFVSLHPQTHKQFTHETQRNYRLWLRKVR